VACARFLAERRDGSIDLERVPVDLPASEGGVMRIVITGLGNAEELARIAARCHFQMNPDRKRAFIIALGS
jgi:hypothetical protein